MRVGKGVDRGFHAGAVHFVSQLCLEVGVGRDLGFLLGGLVVELELPAELGEGGVPGDREEPGPVLAFALVTGHGAQHAHPYFLLNVFGEGPVARREAHHVAEHEAAVAAVELAECLLVASFELLHKFVVAHPG